MAVTTDPYTNTDAVAFIPEVWSTMVNEALFAKTVAAKKVGRVIPTLIDLEPLVGNRAQAVLTSYSQ
jgi:hypothetical protein